MPRASASDAARTGQAVLSAAVATFACRGYARSSLADIAATANVTRGAVYHHFHDKQRLFLAVVALLQEQVADEVLRTAEAAGRDPMAQLVAGSHAFLDAMTDPARVRVLLVDGPAVVGWQEWRELDAANSVVHLRDVLAEAGARLLEPMTALLSGAMNEAALWVAQQKDQDAARKQAHAALDAVLRAILESVNMDDPSGEGPQVNGVG